MPFSNKLPFHAHFIVATWPLTSASRQSRYSVLINRIHLSVWGESAYNTYFQIIYHLLSFPLLFIIHIKLHMWEQKSKHALLTFVVSQQEERRHAIPPLKRISSACRWTVCNPGPIQSTTMLAAAPTASAPAPWTLICAAETEPASAAASNRWRRERLTVGATASPSEL